MNPFDLSNPLNPIYSDDAPKQHTVVKQQPQNQPVDKEVIVGLSILFIAIALTIILSFINDRRHNQ